MSFGDFEYWEERYAELEDSLVDKKVEDDLLPSKERKFYDWYQVNKLKIPPD